MAFLSDGAIISGNDVMLLQSLKVYFMTNRSFARVASCLTQAGALVLLLATASNATPMRLTITITPDIAVPGTVETLGFTDGGTNVIALAPTTVGGIAIQGEFGSSTFGAQNKLTSSASDVQNNNATTSRIQVAISGQNFIGPDTFVSLSASGTWQNTSGSIFSANWFNDPANILGAATATDGPGNNVGAFLSPVAADPTSSFQFSPATGLLPMPDVGNFSMTEVFTYTLLAGGELVSRGTTEIKSNAIAEPASLFLFGSAMIGLGLIKRSKKND